MFGWLRRFRSSGLEADQEAAREVRRHDLVARILTDARARVDEAGVEPGEVLVYTVHPEMSNTPLHEDVEFGLLIRSGQYGLFFEGVYVDKVFFKRRY